MQKFGTYKILQKERLIIEYHSGNIGIEDFINTKKIISSDNKYNSDYDVIIDIRDIQLLFSQADIDKLIVFFKNYSPIVGNRKIAFLTKKPHHVVFTTLFSNGINDTNMNAEIFSTLKAAVGWIGNQNMNVKILNVIFEELKKSPNTLYFIEKLNNSLTTE